MQRDRGVTKSRFLSDDLLEDAGSRLREANGYATIPIYSSTSLSPSSLSPSGANCIKHRVTKMDTLAGVAIKYGVEVADIKRMNGLVTDIQMFAHKSLQIPLPGRHPPSPIMSNGSTQNREKTPPCRSHDDILGSPSRHVSPAMRSLQGFYGLTQPKKKLLPEGTEKAICKAGKSFELEGRILSDSPISEPIRSPHRKSRSLVNFIAFFENGDAAEESDESIRRRQKADAEPSEIMLKEEVTGGTTFSGRAGKGLALRGKPGSRTDLDAPRDKSAAAAVDCLSTDACVFVRKSSSASNLSESGSSSSSIWPTSRWSLKPDAIARPIFDGLPKPASARRNKAALD